MRLTLTILLLAAPALFAQGTPATAPLTVTRLYDNQLGIIERQMVPLAEAMPAAAYGFKPANGAFSDVRTFAQQASHVATVLYMVSAGILGEKMPVDSTDENGPANLKTKEQIVQYLKDAFTYSHRAMQTITAQNLVEMVPSPFGSGQAARGGLAAEATWHSFDHYGQMVVYARMNNVVPPASQPQPPPPAAPKKK